MDRSPLKLLPDAAARLQNSGYTYTRNRPNVVRTNAGLLKGSFEDSVHIFRGVPYAKPPVGSRRFRSPMPLNHWDGVRDATNFGPASYQVNRHNLSKVTDLVESMDPGVPGIMSWPAYVGKTYNQENTSEDCLYLDIWTPNVGPKQKLPVYLYYHGGANAVSSGSFNLERGANLAREENMIVVRPTYRLGALGWVNFSLISDKLPEASNLGVKDQIAALTWVYDNISAFGGDADNITIGGESCGATAVSHLLTNEGAREMIRRAVLQSLSPFNVWCTQQKEEAIVVARQYMELLQIDDPIGLMDMDPDRLLAVHNVLLRRFPADFNVAWRPLGAVIDGTIIPENPACFLSKGQYPRKDFELMIGFAKDEWQFFRGHSDTAQHGTEDAVIAVLSQVFEKDKAKYVYNSYKALYPSHTPGHVLGDVMSMEFFKYSSLCIAENFAAQGLPVHVFQFSYDLPGHGGYLRAVHTGDMPFIWRNYTEQDLTSWSSFDGIDRENMARVSAEMGKMYGAFIREGNPGSIWPSFDASAQTILWFGQEVQAKRQLLKSEWEVIKQAGVLDVPALEERLVRNVRQAVDTSGNDIAIHLN
ncbi:MAG: hypothetical protein M1818_001286 [Claussenomyces sp. TS43310]|nr:MAG: hypothetical protein M1818_001286 [Claussenomyces sp. TS43310]